MQFGQQSEAPYRETRLDPPGKAQVPMTYVRFSSEDTPVFEGLVTSCFEDGLSFRTQHPLHRGQTIFMRLNPDQMATAFGRRLRGYLKSMRLAEVHGCRKSPDPSGGYVVSARYVPPYY